LSQFVTDLIVAPEPAFAPVRDAFRSSYTGSRGNNQFTKVKMNLQADGLLQAYFRANRPAIAKWFNVITPQGRDLPALRDELHILAAKDWGGIHK
jgi:hypothetical protein